MKKLLLFGAGNIGRSFIGQLFSRGGYEVVFVDIDSNIVNALNSRRSYTVVVKGNNRENELIEVAGVRGVDGLDSRRVVTEIETASLMATAVGKTALDAVVPTIAAGIERRVSAGHPPINIILAENVRGVAAWFRSRLQSLVSAEIDVGQRVGLVETSIGKMVPIMSAADREQDPLRVFAEAYNTLIVDAKGFLGGAPEIPGIKPVENIAAYVDRKLFVHNLGHATAAYIGYRAFPDNVYLYQDLEMPDVYAATEHAMMQSSAAMAQEYPDEFSNADLALHVQDLLSRFQNKALKDTVYRIGRDLPRKLAREDRLIGAMLLAARHRLPFNAIADAAAAAFTFHAADEDGNPFAPDADLIRRFKREGVDAILDSVCGLDQSDPIDLQVIREIKTVLMR